MILDIADFNDIFFIGIAGTGMSAVAQWLSGVGKKVSGSDRYFSAGADNDTKKKLTEAGIRCFLQNGEGISKETDLLLFPRRLKILLRKFKRQSNLVYRS